MVKASRPTVKTLTLNKSSDIIVDRLIKPCEEGNHSRCTGWAVLRKEVSPIGVNYFLRCTCACHHKKPQQAKQKQIKKKKQLKKRTISKKAKRKPKPRKSKVKRGRKSKKNKKSKRSKKARRR